MSVLEKIKKLDAEKQKLLGKAKSEALQQAKKAVADLNALGFSYQLVEEGAPTPNKAAAVKTQRRTGYRKVVLRAVKSAKDGITRADLVAKLKATSKSDQQAVSNALAGLKKSKAVTADGRIYRAV